MTEQDRPRVTEQELLELRSFLDQRDRLAQRIGVILYGAWSQVAQINSQIQVSLEREHQLHAVLLQRHGIPAGVDARVDRETGQINIVGMTQ